MRSGPWSELGPPHRLTQLAHTPLLCPHDAYGSGGEHGLSRRYSHWATAVAARAAPVPPATPLTPSMTSDHMSDHSRACRSFVFRMTSFRLGLCHCLCLCLCHCLRLCLCRCRCHRHRHRHCVERPFTRDPHNAPPSKRQTRRAPILVGVSVCANGDFDIGLRKIMHVRTTHRVNDASAGDEE